MKSTKTLTCDGCDKIKGCRDAGLIVDITTSREFMRGERHYMPWLDGCPVDREDEK